MLVVYVTHVCVIAAWCGWQEFVVHSVELHVECWRVFQFVSGGWWHAVQRLFIHRMQGNVLDPASGVLYRAQYEYNHGETYALVLVETSPARLSFCRSEPVDLQHSFV